MNSHNYLQEIEEGANYGNQDEPVEHRQCVENLEHDVFQVMSQEKDARENGGFVQYKQDIPVVAVDVHNVPIEGEGDTDDDEILYSW